MSQASENKQISAHSAANILVDEASEGQRIDNFLAKILKGVPKSHIYRILRSGEVRVNKGRVNAARKLSVNDVVRIPPIRMSAVDAKPKAGATTARFNHAVIYEDDAMLVLDKPAGFAVHGGSGISRGVIEQLRLERPQAKFLELVHRLDHLKQVYEGFSLLEAKLVTGRTHQLRVQLAHLGFPILGDDKYGDFSLNKRLQKAGLKRMFLHAAETKLQHPISNERLRLQAPLPDDLTQFMQTLSKK